MYQHSITPISLPCALRIPEKGQIAHLNVHLKRQLQIDSDSFVKRLMSLMFQTWLENSRKCRMHQTPAQWPSSSNKEQVGHKIAFAPFIFQRGTLTFDASIAVLTFPQQRLLEHHIFLECWHVREYVCLLIQTCSSLSYSSLQRAVPELSGNRIADGPRGCL